MDDFFENQPQVAEEEITEKNEMNADMPPSNGKKMREPASKKATTLAVIAMAVICFLSGCLTVWFTVGGAGIDSELRTLMKIKEKIQEHYYKDITDEEFYNTIFDAINHDLLDAYSQYMTADQYATAYDELAGKRIGIGGVFSTLDADGNPQMRVVRGCGNSPAEAAGLTAGSYVIGFGKTETEIKNSVMFDEFLAFLDTCEENVPFCIRVRVGEEIKILTMSREAYVESYVFYRTNQKAYSFTGKKAKDLTEQGKPLACLDDDTAYIRLVQFGGSAEDNFAEVMKLFKKEGKKNLILDLRANSGGYLETMQGIASYFCKSATENKPIAAVAHHGDGSKEYFKADKNLYKEYFSEDSRICVLADGDSASASECLLGCMLDYGTIGYEDICLSERNGVAKTFGKGIMQATYFLGASLDAIKLTTAEICWPVSENCIHGRGILPEDGTKVAAQSYDDDAEIAAAVAALIAS